jgi:hypothetical protein
MVDHIKLQDPELERLHAERIAALKVRFRVFLFIANNSSLKQDL